MAHHAVTLHMPWHRQCNKASTSMPFHAWCNITWYDDCFMLPDCAALTRCVTSARACTPSHIQTHVVTCHRPRCSFPTTLVDQSSSPGTAADHAQDVTRYCRQSRVTHVEVACLGGCAHVADDHVQHKLVGGQRQTRHQQSSRNYSQANKLQTTDALVVDWHEWLGNSRVT